MTRVQAGEAVEAAKVVKAGVRAARSAKQAAKELQLAEAAAQAELWEVATALEAIRFRLLGVKATLPESPYETAMLEGEEVMDISLEVRSIIECVLADCIEPAIRDLRDASEYRPDWEQES